MRWATCLALAALVATAGACGKNGVEPGSTGAGTDAPVAIDDPITTDAPSDPAEPAADAIEPAASSSTVGSTSSLPAENPDEPGSDQPEPSFEEVPPTFVEKIVAWLMTDGVESGELGSPVPVFEGGAVPDDTTGGLRVLDGVAIPFEGSIADLGVPLAPPSTTWRNVNPVDDAYFENIGQLLAVAFRLDKDPVDCTNFCAITASNLAGDGGNAIRAGVGVPLFLDGFSEGAETSFVDGEVRNVFVSAGEDGSVLEFANPMGSWVNVSGAGTFLVAVYPLGFADEVVFSALDGDDPLTAYSARLEAPITSELVLNVEHALLPEFVIGATLTFRDVDEILGHGNRDEFDWESNPDRFGFDYNLLRTTP